MKFFTANRLLRSVILAGVVAVASACVPEAWIARADDNPDCTIHTAGRYWQVGHSVIPYARYTYILAYDTEELEALRWYTDPTSESRRAWPLVDDDVGFALLPAEFVSGYVLNGGPKAHPDANMFNIWESGWPFHAFWSVEMRHDPRTVIRMISSTAAVMVPRQNLGTHGQQEFVIHSNLFTQIFLKRTLVIVASTNVRPVALLANIAVIGTIIFVLDFVVVSLVSMSVTGCRRRSRRKRSLCVHCGYAVGGSIGGICPECGNKPA